MKDKIRYEVQDLGEGNYEFTHFEKFETKDGEEVEVIKGKNVLTVDKLSDAINNYEEVLERQEEQLKEETIKELIDKHKEDFEAEVELTKGHIDTLKTMLSEIYAIQQ
ncbi:MAG: hypothetical protein RBR68_14180 [Tenuifilaceae bacterium]|nr:hypothetical protein [Tenuifilaceae bacterium]